MERFQISRRRAAGRAERKDTARPRPYVVRQDIIIYALLPAAPAPGPRQRQRHLTEVKPTRAGNCNHEGASDPAIRALPVILLTTCTHAAKG